MKSREIAMAQLNYQVLKESGYKGYILENAPEKVMQFGEGNFLRAFVDDFIDIANEKAGFNGKVVLVQPIAQGLTDLINQQQGLYTLYLRGSENGRKVGIGVYLAKFKVKVFGAKESFEYERYYNWGVKAGKNGLDLKDLEK